MKNLILLFACLSTAINASAENYILYTSTDGKVVNPKEYIWTGYFSFGAKIISNTYENGKGKIEFDGEVTMIGEDAFNLCHTLYTIDIPNSVKELGEYSFSSCI